MVYTFIPHTPSTLGGIDFQEPVPEKILYQTMPYRYPQSFLPDRGIHTAGFSAPLLKGSRDNVPSSRQISGTAMAASTRFRASMI